MHCDSRKVEYPMKLQIVRDDKGKVIASSEVAKGNEVPVKIEAKKGHDIEEVDAADRYTQDIGAFYKTHAKPKKKPTP
jgi:hypothetical protein